MTETNATDLILKLGLKPHPEGGHYRETYRSGVDVGVSGGQNRQSGTAIYFLLHEKERSMFHRLLSDELWFFHEGSPVEVTCIESGTVRTVILGNDFGKGNVYQCVIPANTWFAARVQGESGFGLVSCVVTPGFDFADFEMAEREALLKLFPHLEAVIMEFTKGA